MLKVRELTLIRQKKLKLQNKQKEKLRRRFFTFSPDLIAPSPHSRNRRKKEEKCDGGDLRSITDCISGEQRLGKVDVLL